MLFTPIVLPAVLALGQNQGGVTLKQVALKELTLVETRNCGSSRNAGLVARDDSGDRYILVIDPNAHVVDRVLLEPSEQILGGDGSGLVTAKHLPSSIDRRSLALTDVELVDGSIVKRTGDRLNVVFATGEAVNVAIDRGEPCDFALSPVGQKLFVVRGAPRREVEAYEPGKNPQRLRVVLPDKTELPAAEGTSTSCGALFDDSLLMLSVSREQAFLSFHGPKLSCEDPGLGDSGQVAYFCVWTAKGSQPTAQLRAMISIQVETFSHSTGNLITFNKGHCVLFTFMGTVVQMSFQ